MKNKKLLSCIVAIFIALGMTSNAQSQLISRMPTDGIGKQIVSIHSYSAQTKHQEGPANLLIGDYGSGDDKWCDNTSETPWVIFELTDYYNLDKFVITDARIREKDNGNIATYKIYVTTEDHDTDKYDTDLGIEGWNTSDWELVVSKEGMGNEDEYTVKEDVLDTPKKARYVKFVVLDKGVRNNNGNPENAVRIYGFDIYGEFEGKIDRGNLVSVGSSVLAYYSAANKRERPGNLLDNNLKNTNSKWCFSKVTFDEPFPYVVFDLEKQYDLDMFKIFDCKTLDEKENNFAACDIYVSETAPDLNRLSVTGDTNTCWTHVVKSEDAEDQSEIAEKEYVLDAPVKARFVKLVIPQDKIDAEKATRVYQFQAFGTEAAVPANDATLALLRVSEGSFSPIFDPATTQYNMNVVKEIEKITITASANSSKATLTGAGEHTLATGVNPIKISVTAEDGTTKKDYILNVNRADKSVIATLDTLYLSDAHLATEFVPDTLVYAADVRYGVNNVEILARATQAGATITGTGPKELTSDETEFTVTVTAEAGNTQDYTITVYKTPENLISVNFGDPRGKRIVNVHSYSGKANDDEAPSKLLIGRNQNLNGDKHNKWCDSNNEDPWVIFSLTDVYELEKIVFRDGQSVEKDVKNIGSYEILFSYTDLDGFDDAVSDYNGDYGDEVVVDAVDGLLARYIKFMPKASDGKVIRIYGFDIYGKLYEEVDRGNLVSVGKTIVDFSTYASHRETPHNLIDGNVDYIYLDDNLEEQAAKCEPWAFNVRDSAAFVIIDLEEEYNNIKEFKLYDTTDWIKGYKVSLSSTGNDADWELVADKTFDPIEEGKVDGEGNPELDEDGNPIMVTVGPEVKTITLDEVKSGRYVKIDFPVVMQSKGWNRIREFEVYTDGTSGLNPINSDARKLTVYPNPVQKGNDVYVNDKGDLKIYTLQGALVYERSISGANYISTTDLAQGTYIIRLSNENGTQQAKLIVK